MLKEADKIIAIDDVNRVHLVGSLREFRRSNLFEKLIPKGDAQETEENSMKISERSCSTDSNKVCCYVHIRIFFTILLHFFRGSGIFGR